MEITKDHWRKCSACKKNLPYSTKYYECSVSSCSRKRTGYVFCSVLCWETHVPGAGHRDAGAIEKKSPSYDEWIKENNGDYNQSSMPKRILVNPQNTSANTTATRGRSSMENEVLVVVSKMKQYIKDCADMNTSADVNEILSEMIRKSCDQAIESAKADGRKTVMARDFRK